jgi:alkaline phosphatase D
VPRVTHGVATGDPRPDGVVVWSRASAASRMNVDVRSVDGKTSLVRQAQVAAATDFAGKIAIDGLEPSTEYRYRVWFSDGELNRGGEVDHAEGAFRTAPAADRAETVRFAFSGDLAGQNVCRDRRYGYPIFEAILSEQPEFFIGLGDMIYADDVCQEIGRYDNPQVPRKVGRAADLETYFEHWKYNRADPAFQTLLARVPYVAVWDDHEVVNDFGPTSDRPSWGGEMLKSLRLLPIGLRAFLAYNPIVESPETPGRLYRALRFGPHLELYLLDTRQYRDPSERPDDPAAPKTMLGREQLTWLEAKLAASDATWRVIVSSVPLALPTGARPERGRDGWAGYDTQTGYELELIEIVRTLHELGARNVLWLTTDVHFAAVFRHAPFPDDPLFRIHEVAVGPLSAMTFANPYFDRTLGTERLFYGPEVRPAPKTWEEALRVFSFGRVEVTGGGSLQLTIIDARGGKLFEMSLPR